MDFEQVVERMNQIEKKFAPIVDGDERIENWMQLNHRFQAGMGKFFVILKSSKYYDDIQQIIEDKLPSNDEYQVQVFDWNPTSLKINDPPKVRMTALGSTHKERIANLTQLQETLKTLEFVSYNRVTPGTKLENEIKLVALPEQWEVLQENSKGAIDHRYFSSYLNYAFNAKYIRNLQSEAGEENGLYMRFKKGEFENIEDLKNLPIAVGDKRVPLKALVNVEESMNHNQHVFENNQEVYELKLWT